MLSHYWTSKTGNAFDGPCTCGARLAYLGKGATVAELNPGYGSVCGRRHPNVWLAV
jgi:hypothetical protein